ncbi:MAG: hypothetical protein Q6366_012870 [Candidatus Freyarchaeota archaeon]
MVCVLHLQIKAHLELFCNVKNAGKKTSSGDKSQKIDNMHQVTPN